MLNAWLRDAPPKVVRFPIFPADSTPYRVLVEAFARWGRRPRLDSMSGLIFLDPKP